MDVNPIDCANADEIAQPIQGWANKRGATVPVIDKLSLGRHGCAVVSCALIERGNLTFYGVRGCLLIPRDTRVERSANGHKNLRREAPLMLHRGSIAICRN
jgi:hypothetical protein